MHFIIPHREVKVNLKVMTFPILSFIFLSIPVELCLKTGSWYALLRPWS